MPTAAPPESKRPKLADPQALLPCAVAQEHAPATADAHASCWANAQVASPALAARSALVPSRDCTSAPFGPIGLKAEGSARLDRYDRVGQPTRMGASGFGALRSRAEAPAAPDRDERNVARAVVTCDSVGRKSDRPRTCPRGARSRVRSTNVTASKLPSILGRATLTYPPLQRSRRREASGGRGAERCGISASRAAARRG
jgi:hypothetical protein